jgi:four helix bundle protein
MDQSIAKSVLFLIKKMKKDNIILDKSFDFALSIIKLYKEMIAQQKYILSKQLFRSSTSIGVNVEEATAAISKKDFTAKMSISSKEARETRYWLKLNEKSDLVEIDVKNQLNDVEQFINLLTAIVKTSQTNSFNI